MSIRMDMPPSDMDLTTLVSRCSVEVSRYRRRESSDDRYCLEIFRRALVQRNHAAWEVVYTQFYGNVSLWFRSHAYKDAALRYDAERSYIDEAFRRFWQWDYNQQQTLEFNSLAGALRALHLCLNSAIMDTLRAYARPKEEPIPDYGVSDDARLLVEDGYHQDDWWEVVASILTNPRERRVIYLLHYCGLKPREIIQHCAGEFASEKEIYRLTRNAMDRLQRNADKLRWKLSDGES
jgi:hypothetical protein